MWMMDAHTALLRSGWTQLTAYLKQILRLSFTQGHQETQWRRSLTSCSQTADWSLVHNATNFEFYSNLFIHHSVCLSIHLSIYPFVLPSVCPSIHPSIRYSICRSFLRSIHHSIHSSVHLSMHLPIHPFFHPMFCLAIHHSFCRSIYHSIYHFFYVFFHSVILLFCFLSVLTFKL